MYLKCPQLRTQLENIKALHSDYSLELEKAKTTKEYEPALSIQTKITQAILELGLQVDPKMYREEYVTEIEKKNKANTPLTKAEIIFLYDIDSKLQTYYGKERDPRIQEILQTRNHKEDTPIVFDCQPQEIAWDIKQVNENTKAYIGLWSVEVFQVLRNYPSITNFYESFPDKKIFMQTIETDPNINSPQKAVQSLDDKNIYFNTRCKDMLVKTKFSKKPEAYNLVRFTVEQLGLKEDATTDEIYKRAQKLGLELCPAEVGSHLRLKYTGREWFFIAMKQIADRGGIPRVFYLDSDDAKLMLDGNRAEPDYGWFADDEFVFRFRK